MPPLSLTNSHSRTPRAPEGHRHRQRYSLRIEFLDDEEEEELNRVWEASGRRSRRHTREVSASRSRDQAEPDRPRGSEQRSRRASVASTAAVVGSRNRGDPTPLPSSDTHQARQPSESASRMSVRHHDGAALPERFPRPMSVHERESNTGRPHPASRRRASDAGTQTAVRGYDPYSTSTSPPPPRPPAQGQGQTRRDRSVENAYFDGFLMGQRLANAHMLRNDSRPPRQLTARNAGAGGRNPPGRLSAILTSFFGRRSRDQ
ncbi:hypothetical protein F4818DRAFT_341189 [Hypoxylon cercidicola]|nr:hypothetical protein F4818DRAFT_341189 [Hypoxylon cercidicola]